MDVESLSLSDRRDLRPSDQVLSFVDSIAEIFCPLLQGASILVIPDEAVIDSDELVRQLAAQRITRIVVVPSQLGAIIDARPESGTWLPDLRLCFTSGEALPHSLYERFTRLVPHATLVNLYGSSEVSPPTRDLASTKLLNQSR